MKRIFLTIIALILSAIVEFKPPCLRAHEEQVYVPPMTPFVMVGKVLLPLMTLGHWATESVCDEYGRSRWARRRR